MSTIGADYGGQAPAQHVAPAYESFWPYTPPDSANALPTAPAPQPETIEHLGDSPTDSHYTYHPDLNNGNSLETLVAYAAPDDNAAGGAAPVVQTTEKKMVNNEPSPSDNTEISQLKIDFSKHIPTDQFIHIVTQSSGKLRLAPEDPNMGWWGNMNRRKVYILDVDTPDGPKRFVFAQFITGSPWWGTYENYFALVAIDPGGIYGSDLASAQGVYNKDNAKTLAAVNGALTFTLHMIPTGAALDALGVADMGTKQADWKEAGLSLAADASLLLGGVGKVWQGSRAGKIAIGTAIAIEGSFAAYSGSQTIKFAANQEWLKAAGAGGETLLRLFGVRVLSKDLAAKELRSAVTSTAAINEVTAETRQALKQTVFAFEDIDKAKAIREYIADSSEIPAKIRKKFDTAAFFL